MATVRDIATLVGVSVATVSRVINNSDKVTPETVEKVNQVMKEFDYKKPKPKRKQTNIIAIIVPNNENPFYSEILDAVEKEAFYHGKCMLFFNSRNSRRQEKIYLNECKSHDVDGVFLISMYTDDEYMNEIKTYPFQTILLTQSTSILPSVLIDHIAGGCLIAKHFLANGHTGIGYIGPVNENEEKLRGFSDELADKALSLPEKFMFDTLAHPEVEELEEFLKMLFWERHSSCVTALFCSNDVDAGKVLKLSRKLNISVPEQLTLIGFDNSLTAKNLDITSVSQPICDIARRGFKQMVECIKDFEKKPLYYPELLPPKLVVRSTG
ncbi:LacI family DNA-binding transcriptional regulator [Vibrio brasiliensis]